MLMIFSISFLCYGVGWWAGYLTARVLIKSRVPAKVTVRDLRPRD